MALAAFAAGRRFGWPFILGRFTGWAFTVLARPRWVSTMLARPGWALAVGRWPVRARAAGRGPGWALVLRRWPVRGFALWRSAVWRVPGWAFAQQAGQLGDVRFFDPARPVRAGGVAAGAFGAALADLAAGADGDLPGLIRHQPQRGLLPLAQRPPDRVDQLAAGPGSQLVQVGDQVMAGARPVAGDHQPAAEGRRQRGDRRVHHGDVAGGGVAAG